MIVDRWWRDWWSRSIWLINDLRLTIDQSWSRSTNIDDRRSTQTLMIDDRRWKTHKSFFVTFLQKHQKDLLSVAVKTQKCHFFFEHHIFSAIFHNSIGKDVERRKKQQLLCSLSSSETSLLRTSGFFSENTIDWQQTIVIKMIGKDVERRTKNSKFCDNCLRAKLRFWELRASFLRLQLIDNKQQ